MRMSFLRFAMTLLAQSLMISPKRLPVERGGLAIITRNSSEPGFAPSKPFLTPLCVIVRTAAQGPWAIHANVDDNYFDIF